MDRNSIIYRGKIMDRDFLNVLISGQGPDLICDGSTGFGRGVMSFIPSGPDDPALVCILDNLGLGIKDVLIVPRFPDFNKEDPLSVGHSEETAIFNLEPRENQ